MDNLMKIDSDYATWITTLERCFCAPQVKAAIHVNQEMLRFYWSLGEDMFRLQAEARWGYGFVRKLESDLKKVLPGVKGFSFTNLNYIKRVYLMFKDCAQNFPQDEGNLGDALFAVPWGHIKVVIDKFYGDSDASIGFRLARPNSSWTCGSSTSGLTPTW